MLTGRWFVYWSNFKKKIGSFFCWGMFLSIPSFAYKKIAGIHLFFEFVETHMSNGCISWFLVLKHILKAHVGLWSKLGDFYLMFLELSCTMWMLKSLEFGVWTQELHYAACTCASGLIVCNFFLLINEWVNPFTHVNERGWVSDCVSWVCLCHISDNLLLI